jgi:hypothetical protein
LRRVTKLIRRWIALVLLVTLVLTAFVACWPPPGPYTLTRFEPDRVASLEVDMWKAYYDKQRVRLFVLLVTMLREQYGYSWARAVQAGAYLARSASAFSGLRGDYDRVLPDLEAAFVVARDWTSASFDPNAAARAELAWWVARRTEGQSDVDTVGRRIAEAYAVFYGVPVERVAEAGRLRAEAAHLRDSQPRNPDWARIHALLQQSFRLLKSAVAQ